MCFFYLKVLTITLHIICFSLDVFVLKIIIIIIVNDTTYYKVLTVGIKLLRLPNRDLEKILTNIAIIFFFFLIIKIQKPAEEDTSTRISNI